MKQTRKQAKKFLKTPKPNQSRYKCFNTRQSQKSSDPTKRYKGELTFIAVDSCIVIDMMHLFRGDANTKRAPEYFSNLKRLLSLSVYDENGNKNFKGRLVLCVLPSVYKELSDENGKLHENVKEIIQNRMLVLSLDEASKKRFDKKANKLAMEYSKKGFLTNPDGSPSMDAYIVAESSIFNIDLISRDNHITRNPSERNPDKKLEQIKNTNRRQLAGDFNGNQAEPMKLTYFFKLFSKGNSLPTLQNTSVLDMDTQKILYEQLKYKPKGKSIELWQKIY